MLTDSYNRTFQYLRLSVTDACNFRCTYCLPNGYRPQKNCEPTLTFDEIRRLASAFSALGFTKIRITGGEPTIRGDIADLISMLSDHFQEVALSTNGYRLKSLIPLLRDSNLCSINVSLDSLDEERFNKITGRSFYRHVKDGIDAVLESSFARLKINAVLLRHTWRDELSLFKEWIRTNDVSVRFIELMETPTTRAYFKENHVQSGPIKSMMFEEGWSACEREKTAGPAVEFRNPSYMGRLGLISPYANHFCQSCNRLRVSSRGGLKLCLFGEKDVSLRSLLQSDRDKEKLVERVQSLVAVKPPAHNLLQGQFGSLQSFSQIGG